MMTRQPIGPGERRRVKALRRRSRDTLPPQRACINCLVLAAHAAMRSISLRRCASRAGRTPVLKTFPAIHRAPLCGLERNGRLFSALRADRFCFYAL